jgi:hypothetical protein
MPPGPNRRRPEPTGGGGQFSARECALLSASRRPVLFVPEHCRVSRRNHAGAQIGAGRASVGGGGGGARVAGVTYSLAQRRFAEALLGRLREALDEATLQAVWAEGRQLSLEAAITHALG